MIYNNYFVSYYFKLPNGNTGHGNSECATTLPRVTWQVLKDWQQLIQKNMNLESVVILNYIFTEIQEQTLPDKDVSHE